MEEVRYDFEEFPRYAEDFIRDLLKLMIISKMNCALKSASSKEFFMNLVKRIEDCEAYVVKYGQPLLYAKYRGMEFTDQKVTSQFMRVNDHVIDVTMESVFGEYVKKFDSLASRSESKVVWGIAPKKDDEEDLKKVEVKKKKDKDESREEQQEAASESNRKSEAERTFSLLNSFVDAVGKLTGLDPSSPDSLVGKRFGIRNVSIMGKSLHLEFLIDGGLNIIALNPSKKKVDQAITILFNKSEIANAISALMKQ